MAELSVELVATDRQVWKGMAKLVTFRTLAGEIGIMAGHSPLLAQLADGAVLIRPAEGDDIRAAVHGGFVTVDGNAVIILAEVAELASEIDVERAKALAEAAREGDPSDKRLAVAGRRAEVRLRVAGISQ